jgi:hypothetical protein
MRTPSFEDPAGSFPDGTGKDKGFWIHFRNHIFQFAHFQPGDDGEDDITIIVHIEFTGKITPLSLIHSNATSQFIYELVFFPDMIVTPV